MASLSVPLDLPHPSAIDVTALYSEHGPFLGNAIQRLTGPGPHVDDLLHETYIIALRRKGTFNGKSSPRTWLYGIAANLSMRHNRSRYRREFFLGRLSRESTAGSEPLEDALGRQRDLKLAYALLEKLSFVQREVFVLYELEGMQGPEIAALVGIPLGTVRTRLMHARERFLSLARKTKAWEGRT